MIEPETIWRIIDEGSTPAIALIAYFLWQLERTLKNFITEVKAQQTERDAKLNSIHTDIGNMIRERAFSGAPQGGDNAG